MFCSQMHDRTLLPNLRNGISFRVFVDIGIHQDGLVHIFELTNIFVKHPSEAVTAGDIMKVVVLSVDVQKKRIGLSMKQVKAL